VGACSGVFTPHFYFLSFLDLKLKYLQTCYTILNFRIHLMLRLFMKILIENYSQKSEKYKEDHQEIINYSSDEIVELLGKIPLGSDYPKNPVRLITDYYIITKLSPDNFKCIKNRKSLTLSPTNIFDYDNKEFYIKDIPKLLQTKPKVRAVNKISVLVLILTGIYLPLINLLIIFSNYAIVTTNLNTITIFSALSMMSFIDIFYIIYNFSLEYLKSNQIRKIKYKLLFYNQVKTQNISDSIIFYSQALYLILFMVYSFSLNILFSNLFLIIIFGIGVYVIVIYTVVYPISFLLLISRVRKKKEAIEQIVLDKFYKANPVDQNYYLYLYFKIKSKKIIKVGFLSKLTAIIPFIFLFVPSTIIS